MIGIAARKYIGLIYCSVYLAVVGRLWQNSANFLLAPVNKKELSSDSSFCTSQLLMSNDLPIYC